MRIFPPVMPIDVTSNSSKECWMGVFVRGGMWKRGLIAWFFFLPLSEAMAATEVAYRAAESRLDRRNDYTFTFAVLRLALEQTCQEYGDFVMHPAR